MLHNVMHLRICVLEIRRIFNMKILYDFGGIGVTPKTFSFTLPNGLPFQCPRAISLGRVQQTDETSPFSSLQHTGNLNPFSKIRLRPTKSDTRITFKTKMFIWRQADADVYCLSRRTELVCTLYFVFSIRIPLTSKYGLFP